MPLCDLDSGIARTVSWYIDKEDWWRSVLNGSYDGRRQGLATLDGVDHTSDDLAQVPVVY